MTGPIALIALTWWGQSDVMIRTTTRLVAVDVFAQDKDGQAVSDLRKEDFELVVNHKPHAIDIFAPLADSPPENTPALPRGTFTNTRSAGRGRYTVFLLDWQNTRAESQLFARNQLKLMLPSLPAGTNAALYLMNGGFQIVQEFTTDKELFESKVDSLLGSPPARIGGDSVNRDETRARSSVDAFRDIAAHLRGISGPKKLIWVTGGFPAARSLSDYVEDAIGVLARANVVVESVDACGLAADKCERYPATMQEIADRTGGMMFASRNDLDAAMREALEDRRNSYQISFYLPEADALHSVEIRTRPSGVLLRYPDVQTTAQTELSAEQLLTTAVDAPAVPLTARVTTSIGNRPVLRLHLVIGSAAPMGKIFVMTRFASEEGEPVGESKWQSVDAPEKSLNWTVNVPTGAETMRILVRDEASRDVGTVTISLDDLPDK